MAGNVARRPNGKWRARYRDDSGAEHARHFDRKRDARQWLDQVAASILTGTYVDPAVGRVTFAAFYDQWSERQLWAPGTVTAMSLAARSVPFRDRAIRQVRRCDVESWIKAMDAAGLAPGTIKTRYVNVRSIFRGAVRDKVIATDPTDDIRLPRLRRPAASMTIPTPEEVGALIASARPSARALFALCAFAGLRLGEAAAVQLRDVDFVSRRLRVSRQVQRGPGGTVVVSPPKYGSERVVHLADGVLELLGRHLDAHGTSGKERWLFAARNQPPQQDSVGYWWREALRVAGLDGIKLHDLRHFYASGLIAAGCDVVSVQKALGHTKSTTTLKTYAHLWPGAEGVIRAAAESILAAALDPSLPREEGRGPDRSSVHRFGV